MSLLRRTWNRVLRALLMEERPTPDPLAAFRERQERRRAEVEEILEKTKCEDETIRMHSSYLRHLIEDADKAAENGE